ncbi:MAG: SDR family oxidoreductase [Chlorobiaceae bacterium]|nr:SDR family oxidoreductase [Chlorobiaceae bacterium]
MQNILIIGATSAIAEATARLYAADGANLYLMARNEDRLKIIAADLKIRGAASVATAGFEANDLDSHQNLIERAHKSLGSFDIVLIAHGTLGIQKVAESDIEETIRELQTNAMSTIALMTRLANMMEKQRQGTLAIISSVAGDRGRPSNYVYGTAKAAVTTFCEGLRARLCKSNVHLLTIKPGMVDSPMTAGMELPGILLAKPEQVAKAIVTAIKKKTDVLYTPWFWRFIMLGIIHMPTSVFKKLSL